MVKFANCEVAAGRIRLTLRGGMAEYAVYGYAFAEKVDDVDYVILQPADRRCSPVFRCEKNQIATLTINL